MKTRQEIRYLEIMQKKLEKPDDSGKAIKRLNAAVTTFLMVVFLVLAWFYNRVAGEILLLMLGMVFAGVVLGIASSWKVAETQWPVLKTHIDPESVNTRLADLRES